MTFHTNLLDKLRRRQDRGTICLSAYHALPGASSGKSSTLIGTVEFNDFDFQGTTMETVGSRKKLYVADLAIREDYRRFGVASKLLRRIEEYAELAGYHEIYLHVDLDNKVGQKLYLKNGYSEFPRILSAKLFTEAHLLRPAETYVMLYKNLNEQSCS